MQCEGGDHFLVFLSFQRVEVKMGPNANEEIQVEFFFLMESVAFVCQLLVYFLDYQA